MHSQMVQTEVSQYLILADQLKALYQNIDDQTFLDTLEGISDLPELIQGLIRSSLEDEALISALKQRVEDMQARLSRLKDRFERKRELASWAMTNAEILKMQTADFTLSLRQGPPRLDVLDQENVPAEYLVPQPPRLDRSGLIGALKRGDVIPGAVLVEGEMHVAVRVR